MATPSPLGFGIAGVGVIAGFHAQAITAARGARLVAVAGRTPEKTRAFAEARGVPFWTTSFDELAARPEVDVICVCTSSGAHLEPSLAAARAGKHLVIEKPLEIALERVDELLRAADAAGVRVAAIFQGRFGEGARTVKAAIDAGRFGRLVLASAYVKWHRTAQYYTGTRGRRAQDGGGALMNQAIHAIDLLQWYAGMPAEVHAWTTRRVYQHIEVEDTACASLRFPSGALGTIEASTALYPGWQRRLEICGENGAAVLEGDHIARWDFREARSEDDAIRATKDNAALGSGASSPTGITHHGHQRQIQDLIDALRQNRPTAVDGHEGRKAVALVCALYESAQRGAPVKLA
ncbi:MAG: hypothetical protein A3G75_05530 [Verrucomicrobia bacterium RIFCSPLOWO2_12_FULL_64_8]|nr:MAG: hypothetical protein A3G75_05530 [Verrucomicrobia bacterium RIFCSPLOWO2_12_FULL_64_8]